MVHKNLLTGDDLSVSGARNYKNKTGDKSLNEEVFPNPGELISYVSFLKSHWVTKIQVYGFGSEVIINAASQCRPVSDLLPVRVQFPL